MRSERPGESTSGVELSNVSAHGMWLLVDGRELFLPFDDFPWFRDASIGQLARIERPLPHHLVWPDLDVDLSIDSIENPEGYPLVSGARAGVREPPRP
ncbi:MAG: DUF2442 domain-containing protein [Gemmatimonadota bacterium]